MSQIYECRNWETEHYNSVLEITVSFLGIHQWEPDFYIGFSPALHLPCMGIGAWLVTAERERLRATGKLVRKGLGMGKDACEIVVYCLTGRMWGKEMM
jgi:hypothetical protein